MSAEVKQGYRRTEIGVTPNEWELVCLNDLGANFKPSIKAGPFGSALTKTTYVSEGYKVYGQEQVIRDDHTYGDYFISKAKFDELAACSVSPGDILISLVGTAGKLLVLPDDVAPGVINPRLLRLSFDRNRVCPLYFKYLFETAAVQNYLERYAQGGTMGVLNAGVLRPIVIALPSLKEQKTISKILSDMDALVSRLDQLLIKKRDIQKAAMQQLLTGQSHLPGFTEKWEVKRLGDVLRVRHGQNQKEIESDGGAYPILATGGEIGRTDVPLYEKPSVLIGRKGTIDRPMYRDTPFWTVDTLFYTEVNSRAVAKFIYYRFLIIDWYLYNEASGVPSLNAATIEKIEIQLPSIAEQAAIVSILSDMDVELAALEARRNKARHLKQGMMQELLTGRIRLA